MSDWRRGTAPALLIGHRQRYRTILVEGWPVRRGDTRPPSDGVGEFIAVDLRKADEVRAAVDGVDAIIHAAAWHGVHLRDHPPRDFWELNVDGTYNVFEAAVDAGVGRVVVSSTMGVYGASARPDDDDPAIRVHKGLPLRPGDIYGHSKVVTERLAAFFERAHGPRAIGLRYGMFVPEPFGHYGVRMLYGGVDARDVRRREPCRTSPYGASGIVRRLRHPVGAPLRRRRHGASQN